tara:strand:+ start:2379 stop:3695 length:1317 start_codon:yes stop_codon:yes gene_type:complete
MSSRDTAYSKLDQIYIDNLSVDEGSVVDVKALRNRARAEVQPTLFDLGAVNQLGYGPPPIDILMDEGDKKFSGQLVEAAGRGTTKLIGGTVGDLLGIAKGLYNIPQDQMDQLMVKMEDPAVQQEVISKFDSFMKGFEDIKALDLPPGIGMTSEAVGEKLTEMGIDPQGEADSELKKKVLGAVELGTEIINPIGLGAGVVVTKGVKSGAKLVKESISKTKQLDNGVEQIFKKSGKNAFDSNVTVTTYQKNKVFTDKEGQPIKFYHGSNNPRLKTNKLDIPNQRRRLMYFTTNPSMAKSYSRGGQTHPDSFNDRVKVTKKMKEEYLATLKPKVIEANIKMEKPFIVSSKTLYDGSLDNIFVVNMNETLTIIANNLKHKMGKGDFQWGDLSRSSKYKVHDRTINILKEKGYDGIIFPMIDTYLPFIDEAVQVKKVIKGTLK